MVVGVDGEKESEQRQSQRQLTEKTEKKRETSLTEYFVALPKTVDSEPSEVSGPCDAYDPSSS